MSAIDDTDDWLLVITSLRPTVAHAMLMFECFQVVSKRANAGVKTNLEIRGITATAGKFPLQHVNSSRKYFVCRFLMCECRRILCSLLS